ncbi:hypothetical protein EDD17DRAFT_1513036 [Pisolithus thermaeus]|nr:hypothetical protein EDD17DRAFT_1513036 [Pisolithus thermaeus]
MTADYQQTTTCRLPLADYHDCRLPAGYHLQTTKPLPVETLWGRKRLSYGSAFRKRSLEALPIYGRKHLTATEVLPLYGRKHLTATEALPLYGRKRLTATEALPIYGRKRLTATEALPLYGWKRLTATEALPIYGWKRLTATEALPIYGWKRLTATEALPIYGQKSTATMEVSLGWTSEESYHQLLKQHNPSMSWASKQTVPVVHGNGAKTKACRHALAREQHYPWTDRARVGQSSSSTSHGSDYQVDQRQMTINHRGSKGLKMAASVKIYGRWHRVLQASIIHGWMVQATTKKTKDKQAANRCQPWTSTEEQGQKSSKTEGFQDIWGCTPSDDYH